MLKIWEEKIVIPTYKIGKEDKNPMFYEKRVYQGSSGKVYPHPIIDKIYDEKYDKEYNAVFLENEYLKIMILPEIGGRIQRAIDKTNNYDFIYYNPVVKPALVGLAGPWISGGIEFNWPQHHRPTTFSPVEYKIVSTEDKVSVILSEIDKMYGTKQTASISLYRGKAYIEINGHLYNKTDMPQTFLWWANPAVEVNDNTKSIFPPDVNAVYDHGKRDVSTFPIATGEYYKVDYSSGVDISMYKNLPVPTSYMAYKSKFDFVGGYDFGVSAGVMHVASHHISPGKKQWTWGNGDFGRVWDRNLSDDGRPYIELMTGVYTDNQPDFTWLAPFEEKEFVQYFMPYKMLGEVKNANKDLMLNFEFESNKMQLSLYASQVLNNLYYIVKTKDGILCKENIDVISPTQLYFNEIENVDADSLEIEIYNSNNELLLCYKKEEYSSEIPSPAEKIPAPSELKSNDELYYAGIHLQQYRHATYLAEDYFLEGLRRDEYDCRLNTAMGDLLLSRGQFEDAITYYDHALKRLLKHNERPADATPILNKAIALNHLNKKEEAFDMFYKAAWSYPQQSSAFYHLALLTLEKLSKPNLSKNQLLEEAKFYIEKSIKANGTNRNALFVKAYVMYLLDDKNLINYIDELLSDDMMNYSLLYLKNLVLNNDNTDVLKLLNNDQNNYLELAHDYYLVADLTTAINILGSYEVEAKTQNPMILYTRSYYYKKLNIDVKALECMEQAEKAPSYLCFPNKISSMIVLEHILENYNKCPMANYYLGCLYYDKRRYDDAIKCYEESVKQNPQFPTSHRNLGIAYFNKKKDYAMALKEYELAFALDETNCRILYELDQVKKRMHISINERTEFLAKYFDLLSNRDDLYLEYITLLNQAQKFEEALKLLEAHTFHVWEGGEGNVSKEYVKANLELAINKYKLGEYENAIELLNKCFTYPVNLGEGKLAGCAENHINYYLGLSYKALKMNDLAEVYLKKASFSSDVVSSPMFYNDQPSDVIYYSGLALLELGLQEKARKKFELLEAYYKAHYNDTCKIDYFAVSLPTYLIFDNDLDYENKAYCLYLHGLYLLSLNSTEAKSVFEEVLRLRPEFNSIFNIHNL